MRVVELARPWVAITRAAAQQQALGCQRLDELQPRLHPELQKVPEVPVEITEHSHCAVYLHLGFTDEGHAICSIRAVVAPEIICVEEERNSVARLVANSGFLLTPYGTSE
jgi:hypothetical protein